MAAVSDFEQVGGLKLEQMGAGMVTGGSVMYTMYHTSCY